MKPIEEACTKLLLVLAFAGSSLYVCPASALSPKVNVQTEASGVIEDVAAPETSELSDAAGQSPVSRKLNRRAFREARRHAQLERIRAARPAQPAAVAVPRDALVQASVRIAPAPTLARDDIVLSFAIDAPDGTSSPSAMWTSASTFSGVAHGEFTLSAKVHGRDSSGQPTRVAPRWVAADNTSLQVSLGEDDVIKIKVRNAGESRLTVAGSGFSRDVRILASQHGTAMQVQISQ